MRICFMSVENEKTLRIYEEKASVYLNTSAEHDRLDPAKAKRKRQKLEELIKLSFLSLPKSAKVFEIGSGDGTNAKFIKNLGFDVTASDIADAFICEAKSQGLDTIKFNVLNDIFPEKYFAVFCWRVFVHFTKDDARKVIEKVYDALEDNGIFIFNAINRDNKDVEDEWVDFEGEYHMGAERYYRYFRQCELDEIINETKFKIVDFHKDGGENNDKWLIYVLKK